MVILDNSEFLALFQEGQLVHYIFDPDIPTVPNEKLTVYGLYDNEIIRQAITLFQTYNPEVYVEYIYGVSGDDSVTKEDALKSLNTKIMAGGAGAQVMAKSRIMPFSELMPSRSCSG